MFIPQSFQWLGHLVLAYHYTQVLTILKVKCLLFLKHDLLPYIMMLTKTPHNKILTVSTQVQFSYSLYGNSVVKVIHTQTLSTFCCTAFLFSNYYITKDQEDVHKPMSFWPPANNLSYICPLQLKWGCNNFS